MAKAEKQPLTGKMERKERGLGCVAVSANLHSHLALDVVRKDSDEEEEVQNESAETEDREENLVEDVRIAGEGGEIPTRETIVSMRI